MFDVDIRWSMIDLMMTGTKVRNVREWLGLSCKEFAEETGNNVYELIRVEQGRQIASDAFLARICRRYHGLKMEHFTENAPIDWEAVY